MHTKLSNPAILRGTRVTLKSTEDCDVPDLMSLWNDPRVMTLLGFPDGVGYTEDSARQWLHDTVECNPNRHHYVAQAEGLRFCGEVHFTVDPEHRRAGLDIKFIPDAQGRGLATDALTTLIDHVFRTQPDVDECWTEPSSRTVRAQRLYRRCGLRPKRRPVDMRQHASYWAIERSRWEASNRNGKLT